jgi:hypothetical protein
MNKEWRPENPLKGVMVIDHSFEHGKYLGYEAGASAIAARDKRWNERCTDHYYFPEAYIRHDCPQCRKQSLKRTLGKEAEKWIG